MKTALTETEQRIVEMVHTMDILTDEMNALLPSKVDTEDFDKWRELYRYRDDLFEDLYNTVETYVKEKGQEEDAQEGWHEAYASQEHCTKALELAIKLQDEDRITMDEYHTISKPLRHELHNVQRFAVGKILEKEKELNVSGTSQNPLNFL